MSRIPTAFIDELLARTDIVDVVNARVQLKKKGSEYAACCPFHTEKTPSFYVSPRKQFYHCFGCGAHGTALGFLMNHDNMGFVEAVEELARRAGMEVPREAGQREDNDRFARLIAAQEAAAEHFINNLRRHPPAVDYLKQRGLTGAIARDYRLGFAPDTWDDLIQAISGRFNEEELQAAGLTSRKEGGRPFDRFRGRIMFPIRDQRGRTVGFGGRLLSPGEPKYLNTPETPVFHKGQQLYGLYEARKATPRLEELLVVEGYMDVIALAQFGLRNAVATLGTATTRDHLERLFRVVSRVVFCFDGDAAGGKAAWRALEQALPTVRDGREVRFLFLPQGEDPDTLIRREGPEGIRSRIEAAQPLSDALLEGLRERHDVESREGRAALGVEAARLLTTMPEGLLRSQIIGDIARLSGVSSERLEQQMGAPASSGAPLQAQPTRPSAKRQVPGRKLAVTPVRLALSLLLEQPSLAARVQDKDWLKAVEVPGAKLLAKVLETLHAHPHLTTAALLERWRDSEAWPHLLKLAQWQPPPSEETHLERMLDDALARLYRQYEQQRADTLLARAAQQPLTEAEKAELKSVLKPGKGKPGTQHPA
ncbi:DNA primase [Ectothiorhodospira haloalkaliphila]|uniref:DNA primase n=1 Tax=Ectothiorhodospira haloalkaliphila TaxID=421628 RepID=W8KHM7_9GAMM|nr:DNA primase [Ectothiorhodospira haloalkaliphila]AHK79289.1 DNA primase [Ectothiorhodospira haloalkaliphila]